MFLHTLSACQVLYISVCFLSTLPTSVPSILLMMSRCKIKRERNFSKSFEALMIAIRLKRINSYILIAISFGAADYENNYLYLVVNHLLIFCVLHKLSEKCFRLFSLQCFFIQLCVLVLLCINSLTKCGCINFVIFGQFPKQVSEKCISSHYWSHDHKVCRDFIKSHWKSYLFM